MSNLTKAQGTHQFAWYTCRTYPCADGIPDKLIKGDFEEGSKDVFKSYNPNQLDFRHMIILKCHMLGTQHGYLDITRHVMPDQA
jgi:hypothetical protein